MKTACSKRMRNVMVFSPESTVPRMGQLFRTFSLKFTVFVIFLKFPEISTFSQKQLFALDARPRAKYQENDKEM